MKKLIITSIILTLSLSINAQSWWNSEKVRGNGNVTTETRNTSDYESVSSAGNFDIKLVEGREGKLKLQGEENLMKYIITEVKNGKLTIKVKKHVNLRMTKKFVVTVPYKSIDKVTLAGSGDITNSGTIKADAFKVTLAGSGDIHLNIEVKNAVKTSIAGSGNINLSGKSTELNCSIAGSGDVNAYELKTEATTVSVAGSGNVKTTVSKSIKARVAGSGSIYYKGKPDKIDSKSFGSGSIKSRN